MKDCIFCRIGSGEQPTLKIYEDEHTICFMDIAGDVDGHMLVIPKAHCESILDADAAVAAQVMAAVKKVCDHLVQNCGYEGVDLLSANGESAGQTMPHWHIHIIPRRTGDGLGGRGEWPAFPGSKVSVVEMHRRLTML